MLIQNNLNVKKLKIFKKVKIGNTTITPENNNDTLELASGTNITLNADSNNKKVIINGASAVKNPAALTVQLNGTSQEAYDGSAAKTVNITADNIGAAPYSHSHTPASIGAAATNHAHSNYSTATNIKNGSGYNSTVEGNSCTTEGYSSHAEGYYCKVLNSNGYGSHAEGNGTLVCAGGFLKVLSTSGNVLTIDQSKCFDSTLFSRIATGMECYVFPSQYANIIVGKTKVTSIDTTNKTITLENLSYNIYSHIVFPGLQNTVYNPCHTEGSSAIASGNNSHAEGNCTIASGFNSHAEGSNAIASGFASHAGGWKTVASGSGSHTEGYGTTASGGDSHAEGWSTVASGSDSHAEGSGTIASGFASHAGGDETIAQGHAQTVIGRYNKGIGLSNSISPSNSLFIIGNGDNDNARNNAMRVIGTSHVYLGTGGAYNTSGADYAEYFEWLDGNETNEDRIGYFVALEGDKIKIANQGDYIVGAISGISSIIGNSDEDYRRKFETDMFGRILYKTVQEPIKEIQERQDENENQIIEEIETGETRTVEIPIVSKTYDETQAYIERKNRKEWDVVGMLGQLIVRDDNTCQVNSYCAVTNGGIATASEDKTGYRVIERIADNIIKIIFR